MGLIHGPLFLAIVSGVISQPGDDTLIGITGFLNEDLILPCTCSNRDLLEDFKWQYVNESGAKLIYNMTTFVETYKSRTEVLKNNCSIHLKNLKLEDTGNYTCSFHKDGRYKRYYVNLRVVQQPAAASHEESPQHSRHNFIIFPIIVLLLVVGCLWNLYLKQRRNRSAQKQDVTGVPEDV